MSYFNWAAEQPDDGNSDISQDCIWTNYMKRGEWDDIRCDNKQSVYCVACSKGIQPLTLKQQADIKPISDAEVVQSKKQGHVHSQKTQKIPVNEEPCLNDLL